MVPHPYSNPPANDGDFGADDLVGARTAPANDCTGAGFGGVYTLRATARDEVCEREREREREKPHCDLDSLPAYVDAVKEEEEEKDEEEEDEEEEEAVSSRPSSRASSRGICVRCFCCRRAEGADAGRRLERAG